MKMSFLKKYFHSREKNKIYTIGLLHFVLVCFGIWSLVMEMINYEEPVTLYEEVYIGLHYIGHAILILCLIVGAYTDIPYFLVPWLCISFIPCSLLTIYTLTDCDPKSNFILCAINLASVGLCWFCWYTVCLFFLDSLNKAFIIHPLNSKKHNR